MKLDKQDSTIFNSTLSTRKTKIEKTTDAYVDSVSGDGRHRRDDSTVFTQQNIEFDNIKLTYLDSVSVWSDPTSDNDVSNKKNVMDELDKNIILRINQTLQNRLMVSVGDYVYQRTKSDEKQFID